MTKQQGALIVTACVAGFTAGWIVQFATGKSGRLLSSEKVLRRVKKTVRESLPVDGAWIVMNPRTQSKGGLSSKVYQGGLTVTAEHQTTHYDFTADARTGTLIDFQAQQ
ncbi:hypothetical protein [Sporolactobacillus spathodeae]|uniref:Small secreted protein n=1 Tax=Sporolactobacillus spathodeae TaxID=1465502 RepID=A0ABS2QBT7_9BACL|nr:hypothetical protein [Sporolactobacillus spathodeae]MBM7658890.1 putative small secreted protein [Sporolactobacillus spathodeae]